MSDILSREEFNNALQMVSTFQLKAHDADQRAEIQRLGNELCGLKTVLGCQNGSTLDAFGAIEAKDDEIQRLTEELSDSRRENLKLYTAFFDIRKERDEARAERNTARRAFDAVHDAAGFGFPSWSLGQSAMKNAAEVVKEIDALRTQLQESRDWAAEQQRLRIAAASRFTARLEEAERDTKRLDWVFDRLKKAWQGGEVWSGNGIYMRPAMNGHGPRFNGVIEGNSERDAIDAAMGAQEVGK